MGARTLTWLLALLPQQELGWKDIGEEFRRFTLFKSPWLRVYLHRLKAETAHDYCHDHPWSFVSLLLKGGYREFHEGTWTQHHPGELLIRPATWQHIVVTKGVSWSLIITGSKHRLWGFLPCGSEAP